MADPIVDFLGSWTGITLAFFGIAGALYAGYRVVIEAIRTVARTEAKEAIASANLDELPAVKARVLAVDGKFSKVEDRLAAGKKTMDALEGHAEASVKLHRITLLILDRQFPGLAEDLRVNNSDVWKEYIEPFRNGNGDGHERNAGKTAPSSHAVGGHPERISRRPRP
mgnify:CR=1 FL=1